MNTMSNVIPFKKPEQANTEPIIDSDYWGGSFPLLELLESLKENKPDCLDKTLQFLEKINKNEKH